MFICNESHIQLLLILLLSLQRQQALQRLQATSEDEGADLDGVVAQAVRALQDFTQRRGIKVPQAL